MIKIKRIWFTQQQPFDFMPLRAGLGLITSQELDDYYFNDSSFVSKPILVPKIYTTRKHRLKGEYCVVRGSRFKAKPVEPKITFETEKSFELDLSLEAIKIKGTWVHHELLQKETKDPIIQKLKDIFNMPAGHTFPEFDLGYKGATFEDLKDVLLKCNKGATINTPFHVNGRLLPITSVQTVINQ